MNTQLEAIFKLSKVFFPQQPFVYINFSEKKSKLCFEPKSTTCSFYLELHLFDWRGGHSKLDRVFQMWSIKWIITISNLLTPVNTAQNTVGVLCCWGLWLARVQLAVHQDSLSTELLSRQSVPSQGCFLPRCSTSYLSLLNFLSFLLAHSSSWSLWMAPLICIVSTVSPLLPQVWGNLGI